MADYTKSEGQILDWTLLDDFATDNPWAETTLQTKDSEMIVDLLITVAHNDAVDAATSPVIVRVIARASDDDEGWREIVSFQSGLGQATDEALNANSGAGQGNPERLEVASTADWDDADGGIWLFLKDTTVLVDSCLCLIEGWNDNDYYINAWGLVRAYDNADILYDGVDQFVIRLPEGVQYFNVTFYNTHGTATYAVRVDFAEVDDIE